jgi:peptidoglycan/LPS O-acetylase OafA/YrhL
MSRWTLTPAPRLADMLRPQDNSFGVIRLAMALSVLVSHSYYFVSGQSSAEPMMGWTGHSLGEHAVQVFFFLSGILVTESLLRSRSVIGFATGRVLRIFPGLIVCVVLTALVLGPLVTTWSLGTYFRDPALPSYIVKTVLLTTGAAPLPGVFENLPASGLVNMSLWTLKYEVLCYVALAAIGGIGLLWDRTRTITTFLLAPFVFAIFLRSPSLDHAYSAVENLRYFALYFGMGVLATVHKEHLKISIPRTVLMLGLYVLAQDTPWAELTCALFVGAATLLVATWTWGPLRAMCNKNDVSFGVYIYGAPIQQALLVALPMLSPLALTTVALLPVMVLATLSWTLVEKPALGLKQARTRWMTKRAVQAPRRQPVRPRIFAQ